MNENDDEELEVEEPPEFCHYCRVWGGMEWLEENEIAVCHECHMTENGTFLPEYDIEDGDEYRELEFHQLPKKERPKYENSGNAVLIGAVRDAPV